MLLNLAPYSWVIKVPTNEMKGKSWDKSSSKKAFQYAQPMPIFLQSVLDPEKNNDVLRELVHLKMGHFLLQQLLQEEANKRIS